MPVSVLLVEGAADMTVLVNVLSGPRLRKTDGKGVLRAACWSLRSHGIPGVWYIRDRDFDFEPSDTGDGPDDDEPYHQMRLGWRWRRHGIESYLLDPAIVSRLPNIDGPEYATELMAAGKRIRDYQAARWALAQCRRKLPPRLPTLPDDVRDDRPYIPADLSEPAVTAWVRSHAARHCKCVDAELCQTAVDSALAHFRTRMADPLFDTPAAVLTWCSGKDLAKAMEPWIASKGLPGPQGFLDQLGVWIADNPKEAMRLLPEWTSFQLRLNQQSDSK